MLQCSRKTTSIVSHIMGEMSSVKKALVHRAFEVKLGKDRF
jgi:hypothetical protein